jgi:hypothetical protein
MGFDILVWIEAIRFFPRARAAAAPLIFAHLINVATWALALLALVPASFIVLLISNAPVPVYRVYIALSATLVFIGAGTVDRLCRAIVPGRIGAAILATATLIAMALTNSTLVAFYILPSEIEFRYVKSAIRTYVAEHGMPARIHVITDAPPVATGRQHHDIGEPNLNHPPNAVPLVRAALDELGLTAPVTITTAPSQAAAQWTEWGTVLYGHLFLAHHDLPPATGPVLIIDPVALTYW